MAPSPAPPAPKKATPLPALLVAEAPPPAAVPDHEWVTCLMQDLRHDLPGRLLDQGPMADPDDGWVEGVIEPEDTFAVDGTVDYAYAYYGTNGHVYHVCTGPEARKSPMLPAYPQRAGQLQIRARDRATCPTPLAQRPKGWKSPQ